MRIQYKGGVWKNSEDEILKAAVMKYGKNQWARIASLLVRKSAKQCKARWYEWLDPSIKKTEWTREEEERLLHLAKILPTQWRTIAPLVGRTAAQCLEHYERLLDDAQRAATGRDGSAADGEVGSGSDPRARRVGEGRSGPGGAGGFGTDVSAPETRPARPDPVDMDEEEKEMLSEARARLANTRGKKAKRKAREKQLEEAKRLAQLQKRRELKAAGIAVKPAKRRKGVMDMTTEVPYMRAPVPGFYDTTHEDAVAAREKRDVRGLGRLIDKYEHQRYEKDQELEKRREESKLRHVFGDPGTSERARGPGEAAGGASSAEPPLKRSRLTLPAPQVSDADLEVLAKAGKSATRTALGTDAAQEITGDLITGLSHPVLRTPSGSAASSVFATPRTNAEAWSDIRDREMQNIIKLQSSATPLVGGDNSLLPEDLGLQKSATPLRATEHTPNPLFTPSMASDSVLGTGGLSDAELARAEKVRAEMLKRELLKRLEGLPEPENEYEIKLTNSRTGNSVVESNQGGNVDGDVAKGDGAELEDAEDERIRVDREEKLHLQSVKTRALSTAARRGLPVPPLSMLPKLTTGLQELVQRDHIVRMTLEELENDKQLGAGDIAKRIVSLVELDSADDTADAELLVREEMRTSSHGCSEADILRALEETDCSHGSLLYTAARNGRIRPASTIADMKSLFRNRTALVAAFQKTVKRAQSNAEIMMAGFEGKRKAITAELLSELDKLKKAREQLACFSALAAAEEEAGPARLAELRKEVEGQRQLERELQKRYSAAMESTASVSGHALTTEHAYRKSHFLASDDYR